MINIEQRNVRLFNTPHEIGLRILFIISKDLSYLFSIDRLINLDYLVLNTGDIKGPDSLHPPVPYRGVQLFIKREIMKLGIQIMLSKELIAIEFTTTGVRYKGCDILIPFIEKFTSEYANKLKIRSDYVINRFKDYSDDELSLFMKNNYNNWGNEFINEPLFRGNYKYE